MAKKYTSEAAERDAHASIDKFMGRSKKTSKKKCVCTNHMGTAKQQYKSKDAALATIIKHHSWTGKQFTVYPCPTSGVFHIASGRKFKKPRRTS